jgi:hypothetical protein
MVSSELQATECCSFCSVKDEPVKTKVRAGNLLVLVNKDSVVIPRGFLLNGAQLSGAKKLHSWIFTCKLRFAGSALEGHLPHSHVTHSSIFYKNVCQPLGM